MCSELKREVMSVDIAGYRLERGVLNSIRDMGRERMTVIKVFHAVLLQRIFSYILFMGVCA